MLGNTPDRVRSDFALALAAAGDGIVYTDLPLDPMVMVALDAVAAQAPEPPRAAIDAAERAFAGQLDGSNAADIARARAALLLR